MEPPTITAVKGRGKEAKAFCHFFFGGGQSGGTDTVRRADGIETIAGGIFMAVVFGHKNPVKPAHIGRADVRMKQLDDFDGRRLLFYPEGNGGRPAAGRNDQVGKITADLFPAVRGYADKRAPFQNIRQSSQAVIGNLLFFNFVVRGVQCRGHAANLPHAAHAVVQ